MNLKFIKKQTGFTLVELLVVMLILVALTSITLESTKDFAFQGRYEITKDRYDKIKRAIIGRPDVLINGQPDISGFVADVGRLPLALEELINGYCNDTIYYANKSDCETAGKTWLSKTYLSSAGILVDGWGNLWGSDFTDVTQIKLYSKGKDGLDGSVLDTYDEDYPSTDSIAIRHTDWTVNISPFSMLVNSLYKGSCSASTCSNPTFTTNAACTTASETWEVSTSKSNCEAGGASWTSSQITIQLKLNNVLSNPSQLLEDGHAHLTSFTFGTPRIPIGNKSIGVYYSADPSLSYFGQCTNTNNHTNFTQINCTTNSGIWLDNGSEQYCSELTTATNCTSTTSPQLGGTLKSALKVTLFPNTSLPVLHW